MRTPPHHYQHHHHLQLLSRGSALLHWHRWEKYWETAISQFPFFLFFLAMLWWCCLVKRESSTHVNLSFVHVRKCVVLLFLWANHSQSDLLDKGLVLLSPQVIFLLMGRSWLSWRFEVSVLLKFINHWGGTSEQGVKKLQKPYECQWERGTDSVWDPFD